MNVYVSCVTRRSSIERYVWSSALAIPNWRVRYDEVMR